MTIGVNGDVKSETSGGVDLTVPDALSPTTPTGGRIIQVGTLVQHGKGGGWNGCWYYWLATFPGNPTQCIPIYIHVCIAVSAVCGMFIVYAWSKPCLYVKIYKYYTHHQNILLRSISQPV